MKSHHHRPRLRYSSLSCGGTTGRPRWSRRRTDPTTPPRLSRKICDGSSGCSSCGPAQWRRWRSTAGNGMLGENGWRYLLVDGSCQACDPVGARTDALRHVTLSHRARRRPFRVPSGSRIGAPSWGNPRGMLRCARHQLSFRSAATLCGALAAWRPGDPFSALNTAFDAQLEQLSRRGNPIVR